MITIFFAISMNISSQKNKAVFLDRDGVINEERCYVHRIEDFKLLPYATEGMRVLAAAGYKLIVVSNQAGIARGYYGLSDVEKLHLHMSGILLEQGVYLDAIYYCPHHPAGKINTYAVTCDCRKPEAGMLFRAAHELDLDLKTSILVGDKSSDLEAGRRAGLSQVILVESGHVVDDVTRQLADYVAPNLFSAAQAITALI